MIARIKKLFIIVLLLPSMALAGGVSSVVDTVARSLAATAQSTASAAGASAVAAASAAAAAQSTASAAMPASGVADASNAAAGKIGEFISSTVSAVSLTNAAFSNLTTLALTAGDWDVSGTVTFDTTHASTNITQLIGGISRTSGTTDTVEGRFIVAWASAGVSPGNAATMQYSIKPIRVNVATGATVYLVARGLFSNTMTGGGTISARRVR